MASPEVRFPCPVLRIRVRARGDAWTVVKQTRVPSMTLQKSVELPVGPGRRLSGFWYEAAAADGSVLYRRVMQDPADPSVEVRTEGGGLRQARPVRDDVSFEILVPDLPEVAEVRIFSSPKTGPVGQLREEPARQVAAFPLRDGGETTKGQRRGRK